MNEKDVLINEILSQFSILFSKSRGEIEKHKEFHLLPLYSDPFNLYHLDYIYLLLALEEKYKIDFLNNTNNKHTFFNIRNIASFIVENKAGRRLNDRSSKVE